jgi:hypothetical protein
MWFHIYLPHTHSSQQKNYFPSYKNSLKIPKGQSETVYRRTEHNCQKKKVQKDKQRSTQHTYKAKDRVTRTPLKTEGELRCSGRISTSCSTSGIHRVNLVTNPVISREWGKDREVFMTSGTYPWSFVTQIFHSGQPSHAGDRKIFEMMTSTLPKGILGSVASLYKSILISTRQWQAVMWFHIYLRTKAHTFITA